MATPDLIIKIRKHLGHELLIAPAVNAVVRDNIGKILICRRKDTDEWALPGGIVEPGESILKSVKREVLEETGIRCRVERLTGLYSSRSEIRTYPNRDRLHVVVATFLCSAAGNTTMTRVSDETHESIFVPFRQAKRLLASRYKNRLRDSAKKNSVHVT